MKTQTPIEFLTSRGIDVEDMGHAYKITCYKPDIGFMRIEQILKLGKLSFIDFDKREITVHKDLG